jgi:hypothetical protein
MREFYLGTLLRIKATFRDPESVPTANAPIDPSVVKLTITDETGAETTYTYDGIIPEIERLDVGVYQSAIDLDALGYWHYRWHSEGVGQAAVKIPLEVVDVMTE